jgi:hypothetical protein
MLTKKSVPTGHFTANGISLDPKEANPPSEIILAELNPPLHFLPLGDSYLNFF